jgi:hypothetical protein
MPSDCGPVFAALVKSGGYPLTVADVEKVLGVKHPETARKVMRELDRRGVMEFDEKWVGQPSVLRFRPDWAWCSSAEFRKLLFDGLEPVNSQEVCPTSEAVTNQEVCVPAITPDLVQRQIEREEREEREVNEEEGTTTHIPPKMTGSPASSMDETHV